MNLIAALILSIASLVGATATNSAPAPIGAPTGSPVQCEIVAPGVGSETEIDGQDFWSWRDYVSEDGELIYSGRGENVAGTWTLDTWENGTEMLGYSVEEDSTIWNSAECAASHELYG